MNNKVIEMMLKDKVAQVRIAPSNRKQYEKLLCSPLDIGQVVGIKQCDLLVSSRTLVECLCDLCGKPFTRKRVDVKQVTLCGKACRNEFLKSVNPSINKEKAKVTCEHCGTEFLVHLSKYRAQDVFLCSRECYSSHRSSNYIKDKIYNYQDFSVECTTCKTKIKTTKWYMENRNNQFCTQECYWAHRKEYYKEIYYDPDLRIQGVETLPEKKVREWLEEHKIRHVQEAGFFRKYYADFYLPDYKKVLEVNGDYWHVNPSIYDLHNNDEDKKELSEQQRTIIESGREETRRKEFLAYGYEIIVLWETDIHNDLDGLMTKTMKYINV